VGKTATVVVRADLHPSGARDTHDDRRLAQGESVAEMTFVGPPFLMHSSFFGLGRRPQLHWNPLTVQPQALQTSLVVQVVSSRFVSTSEVTGTGKSSFGEGSSGAVAQPAASAQVTRVAKKTGTARSVAYMGTSKVKRARRGFGSAARAMPVCSLHAERISRDLSIDGALAPALAQGAPAERPPSGQPSTLRATMTRWISFVPS
jgi:hypothetical protein